MREFAEQEIVLPNGPFEGSRFRCSRQPYSGLYFDAVDSGLFNRIDATGPVQSGKTLTCFVTPIMYHLFEIGETVIAGVPQMEMAADKWTEDLLPVLERSRYRDLLPLRGTGSRGGKFESIRFGNGATLKFMSGFGSDKKRSAFTSRVVVITETDGMDESGESSREADKITQLEARTEAYGERKRIYMECTVSIEQGRTWQEFIKGTQSRIALPCPHCGAYVTPEREHFHGWQDADDEEQAAARSAFFCPSCGEEWTDDEREQANQKALLLHRGQEFGEGGLVGEAPKTKTLGFRWSAVNNLFKTSAELGVKEWKAARSQDAENAEKGMRQFVWTLPHEPDKFDAVTLDVHTLMKRTSHPARGIVPSDTEFLTLGIDVGKWRCHWCLAGWKAGASGHLVDYGIIEVPSAQLGVEKALLVALNEFRDTVLSGWKTPDGGNRVPDQVFIDSGYETDVIYGFTRESGERFRPSKGFGFDQQRKTPYQKPERKTEKVRHIGLNYHIAKLAEKRVLLVEFDSDYWKSWIHQRLVTPMGGAGAMAFFESPNAWEHLDFAKHMTSEKQVEEFIAGKGDIVRWERVQRKNHWFDAICLAAVAGHLCGVRLIEQEKPKPRPEPSKPIPRVTMPDGRPFFVLER